MACEKKINAGLDPLKLSRKPEECCWESRYSEPCHTLQKKRDGGKGVSIYPQLLAKRFSFFLGRVVSSCSKWSKAMIQILKVC